MLAAETVVAFSSDKKWSGKERIKGRFLENVVVKSLPGANTAALTVLAINVVGRLALGLDYGQVPTLCVLLTALVRALLIGRLSFPFTPFAQHC